MSSLDRVKAYATMSFSVKGLNACVKSLKKMERIPQKAVTKAAGKGANVVRREIKGNVPERTGALKRGIVRSGERSRYKGKKVYAIMFDPGMNEIFQKPIQDPGAYGGKSDHGYYPASMEYGFLTRSEGGGLSYFPGFHFMRDAAEASSPAAKTEMIKVLNEEIDKEWAKK